MAGGIDSSGDSEEQLSAIGACLRTPSPRKTEHGWRMRAIKTLQLTLATAVTHQVWLEQNPQETWNLKKKTAVSGGTGNLLTGMGQERPRSVTPSWSNDQSCPGTVRVPHPSGCHGKRWDSVFRRRGVCHQDSTTPFLSG